MIIDDLPSISIANDSDEIAIEQGTATKKITKGNFLQEVTSAISSLLSSLSGKASKSGDNITNPGTWRSALGLCYAANDTFSITSSAVLTGLIGNTNKTTVYLDCVVDSSMENISSISVTSMTGYLAGIAGRYTSGNTDYTGTGYTISCTKQGNHHVRIGVTKTSAFPMGDAFTPVAYFGTITLKFT